MESVKKARERLWGVYPKMLLSCGREGANYAKCVTQYMGDVKQGQCQPEFELFKACIQKNAKKIGGKF
jgi:hypothetical protein